MNTSNWLILTGMVVIAGRWSRGESLDVRAVVALFVLALAVTMFSTVDNELANAVAILILMSTSYAYLPDILSKIKAVQE